MSEPISLEKLRAIANEELKKKKEGKKSNMDIVVTRSAEIRVANKGSASREESVVPIQTFA